MEDVAKKELGSMYSSSQEGINKMKDLKDQMRVEFEKDPYKTYTKYKASFDSAVKENQSNFTLNDYYEMKKDVDGYFKLGDGDSSNKGHGDPDYFFETGMFKFKPQKAKDYMNKMSKLDNYK